MASSPIPPIEIGSLTTSKEKSTEFTGSSSGIFFVNTVLQAFTQAASTGLRRESTVASHGTLLHSASLNTNESGTPTVQVRIELQKSSEATDVRNPYGITGHGLGVVPAQPIARDLLMFYLKNWHPLLPFLHGPSLSESICALFQLGDTEPMSQPDSLRERLRHAVVCQCVFNIAALDFKSQVLPPSSYITSPQIMLSLVAILGESHDTASIQAILVIQLYLVSRMSLRIASTICGTLTRLIYHAGLHRCPYRYDQITSEECDIRKRIFWCAYALDRYLSQALGHPMSMRDSDIDVCIPGTRELHPRVERAIGPIGGLDVTSQDTIRKHLPLGHPNQEPSEHIELDPRSPDGSDGSRFDLCNILGHYVVGARLIGRALDMFHRSLQNRAVNRDKFMEIQSSIHTWWNNLPHALQDHYAGGSIEPTSVFTFFFNILYNQLLLITNRPFLSLAPDTLQFQSSLQICVGASRHILRMTDLQTRFDMAISWPGMISVNWMAGLVLCFACHFNSYQLSKVERDVQACIHYLNSLSRSWNNADHCAATLTSLLALLRTQHGTKSPNRLSFDSSPRLRNQKLTSEPPVQCRKRIAEGDIPNNRAPKFSRRSMGLSWPFNSGGGSERSLLELENGTRENLEVQSAATELASSSSFPLASDGQNPNSHGQASLGSDIDYTGFTNIDDCTTESNLQFGDVSWEAMVGISEMSDLDVFDMWKF